LPTNLPTVVPDREPLTELEARKVGDSSYRLAKLRRMRTHERFALTANEASNGMSYASSYPLSPMDAEAVLALLIERETLFLASFNVKIENP